VAETSSISDMIQPFYEAAVGAPLEVRTLPGKVFRK